jgi:ATP-dependent RNA helicase DeaD
MDSFRIEVGLVHGVQPTNIISTLAKEAGLDGSYVGHIDIRDDHTLIELPKGMPSEIFRALKKVRVRGEALRISRIGSKPTQPEHAARGTPDATRTSTHKGAGFSGKRHKQRRERRES